MGLIKDSLRKLKEERIPRNIALTWTVGAKNSLMIKGGFSPNQLVFGKKLSIPNITGELIPVLTEIGGEEDYLKNTLEGMRMAREIHTQQENDDRLKRTLKGRIREHKIEKAKIGDKVYYKREKEKCGEDQR